jgi:hypothetical protein
MARPTRSSQVPQAVVNSGNDASVLGMANFGEQDRARQLSQRVTETDEEATADVHCHTHSSAVAAYSSRNALTAVAVGKGGEESTEDHDQTSNNNGNLTTEMISHVWAIIPSKG